MISYSEALIHIKEIQYKGRKIGLDNIRIVMEKLQLNPTSFKVIHIAGTNGKGSVCAMTEQCLLLEKRRVGLFTSPHLLRINERIKVNNCDISDEDFARIFEIVYNEALLLGDEKGVAPTFFEVLFIMAIYYFKEQNVDYAILETGIGGRLDSTNVIDNPIITAITSIGLDHTEILGNTYELIAYEKAGIIKHGVPIVASTEHSEAMAIIASVANEKKAPFYGMNEATYKILSNDGKNIDFSVQTKYYEYNRLKLGSFAPYQIINAITFLTMMMVLNEKGCDIKENSILTALESFYWPGRMERYDNIILDGAHNEEGIAQCLQVIESMNQPVNVIFGCMKDKDYKDMLSHLAKGKNIKRVYLTQIDHFRAEKPQILINHFGHRQGVVTFDDPSIALKVMKQEAKDELIFCIGSLYLVGYYKDLLGKEKKND